MEMTGQIPICARVMIMEQRILERLFRSIDTICTKIDVWGGPEDNEEHI